MLASSAGGLGEPVRRRAAGFRLAVARRRRRRHRRGARRRHGIPAVRAHYDALRHAASPATLATEIGSRVGAASPTQQAVTV
nr:hypothetical protein [Angustibacter aerolatus]